MQEFEIISSKIAAEVFTGNRHNALRDISRLAGGYAAAGRLEPMDMTVLRDRAVAACGTDMEAEAIREWEGGVEYGTQEPLPRDPSACTRETAGRNADAGADVPGIVGPHEIEPERIEPPQAFDPKSQLQEYLRLLFREDEYVGFLTQPTPPAPGEGWRPNTHGTYNMTAAEILARLADPGDHAFESAVGGVNEASGAWIRFNPLDGSGEADSNVTAYRHALVECDETDIGIQVAFYRRLKLPVCCIVHSGNKSAHAIVRIDAPTIKEYHRRVGLLYEVCEKCGLKVDKSCRNPSRYSRMPGAMRNGSPQYIIERSCGKASWEEWERWIKDATDPFPPLKSLASLDVAHPPELPPPVIEGILREGGKMMVSGASKSGKSFALIELAVAVAEGLDWLGHGCAQGRVLYINLELTEDECLNRFAAVYRALGIPPANRGNISVWNLRGKAVPLDRLKDGLIRRSRGEGFKMIILDPVYKVQTGDENCAADMGRFSNLIDEIASESHSAFVDCHHHSKGAQGGKKAADRASGSGVFARDRDAIVDLIRLNTAAVEKKLRRDREIDAMTACADSISPPEAAGRGGWRGSVAPEKLLDPDVLAAELERVFPDEAERFSQARLKAAAEPSGSGWEVSYVVRSFPEIKPERIWFRYPLHRTDDAGLLADSSVEGDPAPAKSRPAPNAAPAVPKETKPEALRRLVTSVPGKVWTMEEAEKALKTSERSIWRYMSMAGFKAHKGRIVVSPRS